MLPGRRGAVTVHDHASYWHSYTAETEARLLEGRACQRRPPGATEFRAWSELEFMGQLRGHLRHNEA